MATPEEILAVRMELGDLEVGLYVLSDDELIYFIDKNTPSLQRATIDAAKTLMFKLSMRSDSRQIDVLSISGNAKTAAQWIAALKLFLTNPTLRGSTSNAWAGGISKSDMAANIANSDNNAVLPPPCTSAHDNTCSYQTSSNPFLI